MRIQLVLHKLLVPVMTISLIFSPIQKVSAASLTLYPTSDTATVQWSTQGDASHYKNVDEANCNGDTDYNYTETILQNDGYNVTVPVTMIYGKTITNIQVIACAATYYGTTGSSSTLFLWYQANGAFPVVHGAGLLTSQTYMDWTMNSAENIVVDANTTLKIGAIYDHGNKGIKLSNIRVVLTYQ